MSTDTKPIKLTPFDFVKAVTFTKQDLIAEDDDAIKAYTPYIVNRALSYFADTVKAANLMNQYTHLPADVQFSFLLNTIRKRRRFSPWVKTTRHEDAETIAAYYGISYAKARDVVKLHTSEQLASMRSLLDTGGMTRTSSK